jgi:hypothetical protein
VLFDFQEPMMRTAQVVLAALILARAGGVSAGDRPTAADLLSAYQTSVEKLSRVRIEGSESESRTGISTTWARDTTVIRDASRWKVNDVMKITVPASATRPKPWVQTSQTQTLAGCELIQANELLMTQLIDPNLDNPQANGVAAFLDDHSSRVWNNLGSTRVLFGRLDGDGGLPLWEIMGEDTALELLPETETIAGIETYVLTSRGKYGEHKVWFDPSSGGLPRRIEVQKHNGNLYDDEQLGSRTTQEAGAKPEAKRPRTSPVHRESAYIIDNIQIEKKAGVFLVTAFDHDSGHVSEGGEKQPWRRRSYRLRAIDVDPEPWPEGTFRFDVKIPDGLILAMYENAPLKIDGTTNPASTYEWRDGRPQRRIGR